MTMKQPIACTLEGDAARTRWLDWKDLAGRLTDVQRTPNLLRLRFAGDEETSSNLQRLVAAERECCGFVEWALNETPAGTAVVITGSVDGVTAMAQAFGVEPNVTYIPPGIPSSPSSIG